MKPAAKTPSPSKGEGWGGGEGRLRATLHRLRRPQLPLLDPRPTSPFELAVAERLKAMQKDIDQIRTRVNWLLALIVGAAATNVVLSLFNLELHP